MGIMHTKKVNHTLSTFTIFKGTQPPLLGCAVPIMFILKKMRELLAEYEKDVQSMRANTTDVDLQLSNDGTGTLSLSNPKSFWKGIHHPEEHPESLSLIVRDDRGNRLSPTTKALQWSFEKTINLSEDEPFSTPISILRYMQGNTSYQYVLEEGRTYLVVALYSPFGSDKYRFESNKVIIQYTSTEK